jgi:hypothetical protein
MTKFTATIIWPWVYVLDFIISLTSDQTFKESRDISEEYYKRIVDNKQKVEV